MNSKSPENHYDVVVVGGGPGGSLTAMMLARRGRRVALIDRDVFPRFAIGESSTPIADRTLEQIAADYDLPALLPLSRWGRWRSADSAGDLPGVTGGLKRGFTYFDHRGERPPSLNVPADRLLVAASGDDENGDTHWLRAEVDRYLVDICREQGVDVHLGCALESIEQASPWKLQLRPDLSRGELQFWTCDRIVDASGRAGAVVRRLGYCDAVKSLATHTCSRFTHLLSPAEQARFGGTALLRDDDLPYHALDAAVHHLVRDGWLWELPFCDGRVSVGRVWNRSMREVGIDSQVQQTGAADSIAERLDVSDYPELRAWLEACRLSESPGRWFQAARVQHCWGQGGPRCVNMSLDMLALPTTLATVDPLHSTGLAHAITGAQRVCDLLLHDAAEEVGRYEAQVRAEIELIDRVVSLAYRVWRRTDLVFGAAMLYFAIAIADEELRVERGFAPGVATWQADDQRVRSVVDEVEAMLIKALHSAAAVDANHLTVVLGQICAVPLACRPDNLYSYTFASDEGSKSI